LGVHRKNKWFKMNKKQGEIEKPLTKNADRADWKNEQYMRKSLVLDGGERGQFRGHVKTQL